MGFLFRSDILLVVSLMALFCLFVLIFVFLFFFIEGEREYIKLIRKEVGRG